MITTVDTNAKSNNQVLVTITFRNNPAVSGGPSTFNAQHNVQTANPHSTKITIGRGEVGMVNVNASNNHMNSHNHNSQIPVNNLVAVASSSRQPSGQAYARPVPPPSKRMHNLPTGLTANNQATHADAESGDEQVRDGPNGQEYIGRPCQFDHRQCFDVVGRSDRIRISPAGADIHCRLAALPDDKDEQEIYPRVGHTQYPCLDSYGEASSTASFGSSYSNFSSYDDGSINPSSYGEFSASTTSFTGDYSPKPSNDRDHETPFPGGNDHRESFDQNYPIIILPPAHPMAVHVPVGNPAAIPFPIAVAIPTAQPVHSISNQGVQPPQVQPHDLILTANLETLAAAFEEMRTEQGQIRDLLDELLRQPAAASTVEPEPKYAAEDAFQNQDEGLFEDADDSENEDENDIPPAGTQPVPCGYGYGVKEKVGRASTTHNRQQQ